VRSECTILKANLPYPRKASPALTHQSASCYPMRPDDSVEAPFVYSTASALQREGAPEREDFE
jgi:hypothetical protein